MQEMQNMSSGSVNCSTKGSNDAVQNVASTSGNGFAPRMSSLQHGSLSTPSSNVTSLPASGTMIDVDLSIDVINSSEDVKSKTF